MKRMILLAALLCVGCAHPTVTLRAPVGLPMATAPATPAPAAAPKPIDYQALCKAIWPDAQIRSGMAEFPHSTQIYFWVVSKSQWRSDIRTTAALAWQDAYLRTHPQLPATPPTK